MRLTGTVELAGTGAPDPYEGVDVSAYETADVTCVPDACFSALLGHAIPGEGPTIGRNMCFRDLNHGRSPVLWLVWAVLRALKSSADHAGRPNLNVLFVWNMPLRALAKMTNGMVDMGLVDALVREAQGWGLAGVVLLVASVVLGAGAGVGALLWALWVLAPLACAFAANLVRNGQTAGLLR